MSQDKFDDYIRRQLADHSTALDAEGLWQSIQAHQKPKRMTIWWIAGCMLLGLGLAAYTLSTGKEQKSSGQPGSMADKHAVAAATTAVVAPRQAVATFSAGATAAKFNAAAPPLAGSSSQPAAADVSPQMSPSAAKVLAADRPADTLLTSDPQRQWSAHSLVLATDHLADTLLSQQAAGTDRVNEVLSESNLPAAAVAPADASPYQNDNQSSTLAPEVLLTSTDPLTDSELTVPIKAPPLPKRSHDWFIGIGGSTYNPLRSLSSSDPESELLAEAIRRTEKPLEVVGAELQLGRYLRPDWTVQTGIAAQQQTERFEWTFEQLIVDTVIGVQSIIIDANGDSTIITGPIARYQQLSRFKRTFNRYTFIDIPLLTGYEFGEGALKFSVTGGAIINLIMQASGERLSAQEQPVALGEATAFRMRAGLSFQAGMGGSWELHPRWRLHAQLAMRYFPWTITRADSQLTQQYQWLGGQLSLRYLL
jgi:hypothetical protein